MSTGNHSTGNHIREPTNAEMTEESQLSQARWLQELLKAVQHKSQSQKSKSRETLWRVFWTWLISHHPNQQQNMFLNSIFQYIQYIPLSSIFNIEVISLVILSLLLLKSITTLTSSPPILTFLALSSLLGGLSYLSFLLSLSVFTSFTRGFAFIILRLLITASQAYILPSLIMRISREVLGKTSERKMGTLALTVMCISTR